MTDLFRRRLAMFKIMARLLLARLLVEIVPFRLWRHSLGSSAFRTRTGADALTRASHMAREVDWAAHRLGREVKCLPRAVALSWLLRRNAIAHCVVMGVRPKQERGSVDDLHAWVEVQGKRILGDLPGPWVETLRL